MKLEDYFKEGKVSVWKENFAIVKSKRSYPAAFANIIDKNETTVIIEQSKINSQDIIEMEKDYKLLTFDMVLPFELVGFLARVSQALARKGISIFAISAYSTDHLLVKKENLEKTIKELEGLGLKVEYQ